VSKLVYVLLKSLGLKGLLSVGASLWFLSGKSGMTTAVVVISSLIIHELGHSYFCYIQGLPIPPMRILPIGGYIRYNPKGVTPNKQAWVSLGGPLLGGAFALFGYYLYSKHGTHFLLMFAVVGSLLNLMNLMPIYPLDGGKLVDHLHKNILFLGIPCYIWLVLKSHSLIIILIGIIFVVKLFSNSQNTRVCNNCENENDAALKHCKKCHFPLQLTTPERTALASSYAVLLVVLCILATSSFSDLKRQRRSTDYRSGSRTNHETIHLDSWERQM
jgi:Zn-dependent protease